MTHACSALSPHAAGPRGAADTGPWLWGVHRRQGSPGEDAYEREPVFAGTDRHDPATCLEVCALLGETRVKLEDYRRECNSERPHSSLGYRTPLEFKQAWIEDQTKRAEANVST